jgi:hypothetical protein
MTKKSLLASLLLAVCLALTAHAGTASRFSYLFDLNPFNRERHLPLPAPEDVVKQGAAFYSLTAFNRQRVTMALFDAAGRPLADISLKKDGQDGAFFCQLTGRGGEAVWVKLEVTREGQLSFATLTSSTGRSLRMKVAVSSDVQTEGGGYTFNSMPLKSINVYRNGRWEPLRLDLKAAGGEKGGNAAGLAPLQREEERFYTTPETRLLRAALTHMDEMAERTLSRAGGGACRHRGHRVHRLLFSHRNHYPHLSLRWRQTLQLPLPAREGLLFYRRLRAQRLLFPRLQRVPQRRRRLYL